MTDTDNTLKAADISTGQNHVLIAGAGIAGLTAALCFEASGCTVSVFERANEIFEIGAGVQLSPNATRVLERLHVLPRLAAKAVTPGQLVLASAKTSKPLLTLDLASAKRRWGAPYLVAHRADLHEALMAQVKSRPSITLTMGTSVLDFQAKQDGVQVALTNAQGGAIVHGDFLVGADGVWSSLRQKLGAGAANFSGQLAYRCMLSGTSPLPNVLRELIDRRQVVAFLAPDVHLVAYPLRHGESLNLVAVAQGAGGEADWQNKVSNVSLPSAFGLFDRELAQFLMQLRDWTSYPIHVVPPESIWSDEQRVILIGDAAHAMTPFAAQGAAMAIEDAAVLATAYAHHKGDPLRTLASYQVQRRPRIKAVAKRARANKYAYHTDGVVALARNALFAMKGQKMLNGLDWLYGFDAQE